MRLFFVFFVLLIAKVNAGNNNVSLTEWKRDKITKLIFSHFNIKNTYDGWVGFAEIKENTLPITVYLENDQQICQYDLTNDTLSRFDQASGKFHAIMIFDKYRAY